MKMWKILVLSTMVFTTISCGGEASETEKKGKKNQQTDGEASEKSSLDKIELSYRDLSLSEFMAYNEDPKAVLLDVRTPEEWSEGIIDDAHKIDWMGDTFETSVKSNISSDKSVYVYCRSGGRSVKACEKLIEMGYINVYNLLEGYVGYAQAQNLEK